MSATSVPTRREVPRGPVRRARRGRGLLVAGVVLAAGAGAVLVVTDHTDHSLAEASCAVADGGMTYTITPEQAQNAAIITDVAVSRSLPDHAATIALATSLQETKLRNLDYGDRDSLGLFQQRPSQGWGTAAEVSDPVYASTAFYEALVKLPSWQSDSVATAAQAVQRSADGDAYASWEGEARALAIALTGEHPAGLTCSGGVLSTAKAQTTTTAAAVSGAVTSALGGSALSPGSDTQLGRAAAARLVADATTDGITRVAYDGYQWTAARGTWVSDPAAGATVTFTLAVRASTSGPT
jgi:hypothetical protein